MEEVLKPLGHSEARPQSLEASQDSISAPTRLDHSGVTKQIGKDAEACSSAREPFGELPGSLTNWLNTEQAAHFLGIPVGSLRNMTSNGRIPYYKLGRRNRYRLSDLHELLLSEKRGS